MNKEENVVNYYVICNRLKHVIRTGWKEWNVKKERLESVAEHIYGVQMLALAMKSEYQYDIDIEKVILMLAIHELGETVIGDLTQFDIEKEEKEKIEAQAVEKVLGNLMDKEELNNLFYEFDAKETKEAKFAYLCDKLECDLQSKLYGEEDCVDLNEQKENKAMSHPVVKSLLEDGLSWSEMWLVFGRKMYPYDENFRKVSEYAENHIIGRLNNNIKSEE